MPSRRMGILDIARAGLLAGVVAFGVPAFAAFADPSAIEALLDAGNPGAAEAAARAALAHANLPPAEAGNLQRLLGDALFAQKRFAEAEPVYRAALGLRVTALGNAHPDIAVSLTDLALTLKELARYDEAEPLYRQAIAIREAAFGPEHWDVARSWWRLARMFDARRDFVSAASIMQSAIAVGERARGETDPTVVAWIGERAAQLHDTGDFSAAEPLYRQAIARAADGADAGPRARRGLGNLLRQTGRLAEAVSELRAAAAGFGKISGPESTDVATTLEALAGALLKAGKITEAVVERERALAIRERSASGGTALIAALRGHGAFMMSAGQPAKAAVAFARVAEMAVAASGRDSLAAADAWEDQALALRSAGERKSAESLLVDAVKIRERLGALATADGVTALLRLAGLAADREDIVAAEAGYKRAITLGEQALGPEDALVGYGLNFLGSLLVGQNRLSEAEPLLTRAVAVLEKAGGGAETAARTSLSLLLVSAQRFDEAIALLEQSAKAFAAESGENSADVAKVRANIGQLRERKGEHAAAEVELRGAIEILEKSPAAAEALSAARLSLATAIAGQRRHDEAIGLLGQLRDERAARWGEEGRQTLQVLSSLALAHAAKGEDRVAAGLLEAHVAATEKAALANAAAAEARPTGAIEDRAISSGAVYDHLVRLYGRLADADASVAPAYDQKAFQVAQRVIESQAAAALQRMAARQASGSGDLARLLREREDQTDAWRRADRQRTRMLAGGKHDAAAEAAVQVELTSAETRIAAIDSDIAARFPAYSTLQMPKPLDFAAVQSALGANEVLLFYADLNRMNDEDFVTVLWVVPKAGAPRRVVLGKSTGQLSGAIRALRGLLGVGGETRGAQKLGAGVQADRVGEVLTAGEEIYKVVLGPVADMIDGKSLVVVPSKKLANLPFQLLVSTPAPAGSADRYRDAGWLAKTHAVTVLPSVASLAALGDLPAAAAGRDPYVAFANPLLTGRFGDDRRAFERAGCAPSKRQPMLVAAAETPEVATFFRGGSADVAAVRALAPLPETTDEVCAVAKALGVGENTLRLGASANEAEIKEMSQAGALEKARILHFATHGLVSGELQGLAEPAIVLSPPETATPQNDGLLTASEVTTLKLDADWVILSACNTASGAGGGEALSGLARAFFYAGARALLVSHWPVNSEAAVNLVTSAVGQIARDPSVDRAEALRRAMTAEIAKGGRHADPANWAPFILVGAAR